MRIPAVCSAFFVGFLGSGLAGCAGLLGIEDRTANDSDAAILDATGASDQASASNDASAQSEAATSMTDDAPMDVHIDAHGGSNDATTDAGSEGDGAESIDARGSNDAGDSSVDAQPQVDAASCADPCPLKTGLNHPWAMTSDANRVYWVEYGSDFGTSDGSAKSCPIAGCDSGLVVYTQTQINPTGIAVDGTNVYWNSDSYSGVTGGIWSCPLSGCASPTRVATATTPYGIAVDATYVYWTDDDDQSVRRIAKTGGGGGPGTVLYQYDFDATAGGLLFDPQLCLVDANFIYATDSSGDAVRLPLAGGDQFLLGTGPLGSVEFGLTIDPTSVYYGEPGMIIATSKGSAVTDGGAPIVSDVPTPRGLALDPAGGTLYWANYGSGNIGVNDGTVGRVGIAGTAETILRDNLAAPQAITVSGAYALWISAGTLNTSTTDPSQTLANTGALWRTAK